jgi:DNA polymerase IV
VLLGLVDRVTRRMRAAGRIGRTVVLRLRFEDFARATRSSTLAEATAETHVIRDTARALLASAAPTIAQRGLTLVGVAVTNLENESPVQLALPFDRRCTIALDFAVDEIRARFGLSAITRAVLLGRDLGPAMPLLPD